jgi:hypothetical protein
MNDGNAKQQIVDKIKNSTNILVTVSNNPSVDELSAALGLTLMLNKMNKHATAVFSGAIPPAITFLDPQKTFEDTVNSLRDFIIALDKEKADHLRYKVEGEVVKIFITPYRTTITNDDLEFSQGDYNVELVLALGVKKRDNLDKALEAHGRILHDATVATMSAGETSELGSIDWHEENASCLSEMLVSLSDSLKSDKPLLDEQIATAFLTGVVAATDRFSNNRTSSKVMTMAAQLMAAGANQQLIAAKLEDANEITGDRSAPAETNVSQVQASDQNNADGTTDLSEGQSTKVDRHDATEQEPPKRDDGSLEISHEAAEVIDQVAIDTAKRQQEEAARVAEENLAAQLPSVTPVLSPVVDLGEQLAKEAEIPATAPAPEPEFPKIITKPTPQLRGPGATEAWQTADQTPSMGGTLNATTEQAAEDQRRADEIDRNRTILTHTNGDYVSSDDAPSFQAPLNAATMPPEEAPLPDLFTPGPNEDSVMQYEESVPPSQRAVTLADIDQQNRQPHEEARDAVNAAFGAVPFTPSEAPQPARDAQFSDSSAPVPQSAPAMPPLPDFSTLPPLPPLSDAPMPNGAIPPEKLEDMFAPAPQQQTPPPQSNDPAQFKIPGQQ